MTDDDIRGALQTLLADEPPMRTAVADDVRRGEALRTRRHRRWAGVTTAVIVVAVVAAIGLPALRRTSPAPVAPPPPAPTALGWTTTEPTVADYTSSLDVSRTLQSLDGVAARIERQLAMVAVAPASPHDLDSELGAVQLAYRTADGSEVHVVVEGSLTASATASCVKKPSIPEVPQDWPAPTAGERPRGSDMCTPAPVVATTKADGDRIDRTVAEDVEPLLRGAVSVTITSASTAPAPVTVATVVEVVDELRQKAVFASRVAGPIDVEWVRTEPTESGAGVLDLDQTLSRLGAGASRRIQGMLALTAVGEAEPYDVPRDTGAVQLVYRTADDVEVQVLVQGAIRESTETPGKCPGSPPPDLTDWPTEVTGKRNPAPEPGCYDPRVIVTDAGGGRIARTVAEWGESLGHVSVTITSDASVPAPTSLGAADDVLAFLFDKGIGE